MSPLKEIVKLIDWLNEWVGKIVYPIILIIGLLILLEVVARYLFNSPTTWVHELSQLAFGSWAVLSGGHIQRSGGHIRVDIIYDRFSQKGKAIADIVTFPFFIFFVGLLFYRGWDFFVNSVQIYEHSGSVFNPPLYPFKLMIPIGALLLLLQGIVKFSHDISTIISRHRSS